VLAPQQPHYRGFLARNRVLLAWVGTLLALAVAACAALAFMFPMVFPRNPALSTTGNDGDLHMSVLLIEEQGVGGSHKFMMVNLLLENRSKTQKFDFYSTDFLDPAVAKQRLKSAAGDITDEHGNHYNQLPIGPTLALTGSGVFWLHPGEFVIFSPLGFGGLVDGARELNLDLPSPSLGSQHHFKFHLSIKRESITYRPLHASDGETSSPMTGTVLFKRSDFQAWFDKDRAKRK
jgi:hypothetical protein